MFCECFTKANVNDTYFRIEKTGVCPICYARQVKEIAALKKELSLWKDMYRKNIRPHMTNMMDAQNAIGIAEKENDEKE